MGQAIAGLLIAGVLLVGASFGSGKIQAFYNRTVGIDVDSSETDRFHYSKGHTDGMAQDLSKYKLELAQTKDPTSRGAIIQHINEQFANFDERTLINSDLAQFLNDVRNGNIQ